MHRLSLSSSLRRSGCRGIAGPARPSGPLAPARRPGAAVMSTDAPQALPHKPTLAQRLGQSFNSAGISLFARVALSERPLALPHLTVPDIRWVDWAALAAAGFQGCVFDKDNTLTVPYSLQLHPRAKDGLAACMEAFDGRVVLYSNSAGLEQFDPEGVEARTLEVALGVPVLRHREKKPAGGPEDMERHFGCGAHRLVMVGDRYLTDIVFGNRNGMLTVRPAPFTAAGEPKAVLLARAVEEWCVSKWQQAGVQLPPHPLIPTPAQLAGFIREPSSSTSDITQ